MRITLKVLYFLICEHFNVINQAQPMADNQGELIVISCSLKLLVANVVTTYGLTPY